MRRSAYVPLYHEACSDFIIATKMVEQGLRAVYEPDAVCTEETNRRSDNEMKMRVRIIAQTFTDLWRHAGMMNPFRSGFYAMQLLSHKVMRYLVPFFLIAIFAASATLAGSIVLPRVLFMAQLACYACAALAWLLDTAGDTQPAAGVATIFCARECRFAPRLVSVSPWRALCALGADSLRLEARAIGPHGGESRILR